MGIDKSLPKNVIITSMELGGVGWFTSILSEIHNKMFGSPIRWNYEVPRFEATRERRPLPKGWGTVWNARPQDLVKRDYDRVLGLQKSLEDAVYSHTLYHRTDVVEKFNDLRKAIDWIMLYYPGFYGTVKRKWFRLEIPFTHEKYERFHMDALNQYTVKTFDSVLDFLGFPKEGRPMLLPVKPHRDWESYSNVSRSKDWALAKGIKRIHELYMNDLKLNEV